MGHLFIRIKLLILTVIIVSAQTSAIAQSNVHPTDMAGLLIEQKNFISRFSGASPLKDETFLKARGSRVERTNAANFLADELLALGHQPLIHHYSYPNIHWSLDYIMPPFRGQNVYTVIPSTDGSSQYVIIGAHYDSVPNGPGAVDNATGVSMALSVSRVLLNLNERNINFLIVFFDHEEEDGAGSKSFAKKMVREDLDIHSMHNIDMIGWDGDGDGGVELDIPTPALARIYEDVATRHEIPIRRVRYNSTDHQSFRDLGIDAVCLSEQYASGDSTPHHHKSTDTADTVNYPYLAANTLFMTDVMVELAHSP